MRGIEAINILREIVVDDVHIVDASKECGF
jgi:hypothetical protein